MAGESTAKVWFPQGGTELRVQPGGLLTNDGVQAGTLTDLIHTVGTADGTVDDVGGAFNQTTLNNNFREITARVNAIVVALRGVGIIAP